MNLLNGFLPGQLGNFAEGLVDKVLSLPILNSEFPSFLLCSFDSLSLSHGRLYHILTVSHVTCRYCVNKCFRRLSYYQCVSTQRRISHCKAPRYVLDLWRSFSHWRHFYVTLVSGSFGNHLTATVRINLLTFSLAVLLKIFRYDGTSLVSRSVQMGQPMILVSANHRINAFGFLRESKNYSPLDLFLEIDHLLE
jgi:hypothetical protein